MLHIYIKSPCKMFVLQRSHYFQIRGNHIGGVLVNILATRTVDRGFEPRSGQAKDCKIGICCFFAKHAALRRKSKDWLTQNQNNVSAECCFSVLAL